MTAKPSDARSGPDGLANGIGIHRGCFDGTLQLLTIAIYYIFAICEANLDPPPSNYKPAHLLCNAIYG